MSKLYRSRSDSMVAGVAGGLGNYFGIDSSLIRLFFVLLAVLGDGVGILVYILMAIIVPIVPEGEELSREVLPLHENPQAAKLAGGTLILLGLYYFVDALPVPWLHWVDFDLLWPVLLIAAGAVMLLRFSKGE